METPLWYELLDQLVYRAGLSRPQIGRRASVSPKTIASWLRGDVSRPRRWQPLARVLAALHASATEADRVLQAAGHRPVAALAARADEREAALLAGWLAPAVPFMAPDQLAPVLVGRDQALARLRQLLRQERRAAVWGMGGVGKTTLAIQLAHELKAHYPDGIFWGNLRGGHAAAVLESWGQACGVSLRRLGDFGSRAAHMRGLFSQKRALLILDDVVDGRQALQMMPSQLSACAVLVTTRSADVALAVTRHQPQLTLPLTPLPRVDSRALLAGFLGQPPAANEAAAADRVAELLGDLPLALQICAALCLDSGLTLQRMAELLAELRHRLEHLQLEEKPLVRLAFEQSWALLDDASRRALATLAVFEGRDFPAPAFAACAGVEENQGLLYLTRLSRRSLVRQAGPNRYQQHPLLAAFSLEKLAGKGNEPWRRLAHHYHRLVAQAGQEEMALPDEWDNIMAGMGAAHRLAEWPLVLAYYRELAPRWQQQGRYTAARTGSAWAEEAAAAVADRATQAEIALHWGLACLEQSEYEPAQAHLARALAYFQALDRPARVGDVHYHLARIALARDDFDTAEAAVQTAWRHYQQAEHLPGMGQALYRLGNIHFHRGGYERAIALAEEAISWLQAAGDGIGQLRAQMLAASACLQLEDVARAQVYGREAQRLARAVDDPVEMSVFYYTYADLCRFQGEFARAREYALQALALYRQMQDRFSEANGLNLLAGIEVRRNDAHPEQARFDMGLRYCRQGIALCEQLEYTLGKAMLLLMRGRLLAQQGETEDACAAWRSALALARALDHEWLPGRLQTLIASHCEAQNPG